MISTMLLLKLIVNPMGRILVRRQSFIKYLKNPCHPTCIRLNMWPRWKLAQIVVTFMINPFTNSSESREKFCRELISLFRGKRWYTYDELNPRTNSRPPHTATHCNSPQLFASLCNTLVSLMWCSHELMSNLCKTRSMIRPSSTIIYSLFLNCNFVLSSRRLTIWYPVTSVKIERLPSSTKFFFS